MDHCFSWYTVSRIPAGIHNLRFRDNGQAHIHQHRACASIIADCISNDFGCRVVFWDMTPGTVGDGAVEIQAIGVIG